MEKNKKFDDENLKMSSVAMKKREELMVRFSKYENYLKSLFPNIKEALESIKFFDEPASTRFHNSFVGGLAEHSFNVVDELLFLTDMYSLKWKRPESPIIIGLFHDLCKINFYTKITKTTYDKFTNNYIKEDSYIFDNKHPGYGIHGDASVVLALRLMPLTDEEIACIRFHMGCTDNKMENDWFRNAYREFPNVLFTNIADTVASLKEEQVND